MPGPYPFERRLGAFPTGDGRAEFRVWAPSRDEVTLRVGDRDHAMADAGYGVREATVEAAPGDDYAFVVDGIEFPDPATRRQPHGLRGRSRLLDPAAFAWTDGGFGAPAAARLGPLRAARRHVHARRARSTPRSSTCAACASSGSRRSS